MVFGIFIILISILILSCRYTWWRRNRKGVAILLYHHIGTPPKGIDRKYKKLYINEKMFFCQMNYLKENGYHLIDFKTLQEGGNPSKDKTCIITFDDGYSDIFNKALPIMEQLGFFGVVFLDVGKIEEGKNDMLSWEKIQIMRKKGWEFGSHTMNHANLERLPFEECEKELIESKKVIEDKLGEEISLFAYPYGKGVKNPTIQKAVESCGYKLACAIRRDKQSLPLENPFLVRRVLVRGDDNMIDFKLSLKKGRSRC